MKNRSPDRANRLGEGLLGTAPWLACIGRAKEGKKLKVCETGYMGEGQKTELYLSPPHCQPGNAVQCPHFFIQVPDQKKLQTQQGPKKCF